jgi:hypothetical protein
VTPNEARCSAKIALFYRAKRIKRPDYDEQLRVLRAHCKHTQKHAFIIRLDPAGQAKERNCVTLTFRALRRRRAVREFVGDHVKVADEESTIRASVAEDSGWKIPA